jgi:hypothetical protein
MRSGQISITYNIMNHATKQSFVQTINEIFSNSNEREQQESSNDDNSTRRSENDPEKNDKVFDTASSAEGEQLISKAK